MPAVEEALVEDYLDLKLQGINIIYDLLIQKHV